MITCARMPEGIWQLPAEFDGLGDAVCRAVLCLALGTPGGTDMQIDRRKLLQTAAAGALPLSKARAAQPTIKIGVLNDLSGPYRDLGGMSDVNCVRQAVQEFGSKGFYVEVVYADHQNKPDVGVGIARQWLDRDGVDMIADVPSSAVALAVNEVCRDKNKAYVNTGAGTTDLTGRMCAPTTIHWTYDTYMLAKSTGEATVKQGGDTWYFITADYVFGKQLQRDTAQFITQAGAKVLGASVYPFPGTTDFASFLASARASGAKVLGFANAGMDLANSVKQAREFGLTQTMRMSALLVYLPDVHGLGLDIAQGLTLTETFYWDLNDRTRAFTNRVKSKLPNYPHMGNAGVYAASLHYLKAVADLGVVAAKQDGRAVVARMKAMPTNDDCFGQQRIREDGLFVCPSYLFQVKSPEESTHPWDCYKLLAMTPADEAWEPLDEEQCAMLKAGHIGAQIAK